MEIELQPFGTIFLYQKVKCDWCDGWERHPDPSNLARYCEKCGGVGSVTESISLEDALAQSGAIDSILDAITALEDD